jgi:lipopolysaccharide transport system ATP-binding protein
MSSEIAIKVNNLGKVYHVYEKPSHRLLQMFWRGARNYYREFWAVENVSFEIRRGETVGIIGRNGAGKSTLLQMICGTLNPTQGEIEVNGKVAALLELGAGFNPEFTGRENVYLAASLYGLTAQDVDARFAAIVSFADIGDFVEQPVKTYSSGMFVRLAFAVIAHVDADILVVDEALSVGDAYFQQKCMRFLAEFQARGGTLLFVSHDMGAVNALCASAVLLRRIGGRYLCDVGSAKAISSTYLRELYDERTASSDASIAFDQEPPVSAHGLTDRADHADRRTYEVHDIHPGRFHASPFRPDAESFGTGQGSITGVALKDKHGNLLTEFTSEDEVTLTVYARTGKSMTYPAIGFILKDRKGQYILTESTDTYLREEAITVSAGQDLEAEFSFLFPPLIRGEYTLDVAFAEGPGDDHVQHHWMHDVMVITAINNNVVHGLSGAPSLNIRFAIG